MVLVALGLVIFVHELGHFLVAKACGVKVEKFFIGFDVGGIKLFKFRRGETEYGIGVLPLGGYVKMLGQEDNPARIREEIERASRLQTQNGSSVAPPADQAPEEPPLSEEELRHAQAALYDPRSYLAKSVPKRMAIISAGVVMNMIFAFVFAVVAYVIGVTEIAVGVGDVIPGRAAWQMGLRDGDEILAIGGEKAEIWEDLTAKIRLGDLENGVPMLIRRQGVEKPFEVILKPDRHGLAPSIGIRPPSLPMVARPPRAGMDVVQPGSSAATCGLAFQGGDRIVEAGGIPIRSMSDWNAALASRPDQPLSVTIERSTPIESDPGASASTLLRGTLAPNPMWHLGLEMGMGEIVAVQQESPAAKAGVRPGDRISRIDGQDVQTLGDPLRLPDLLAKRGGETIRLTLLRGEKEEIEIPVVSRSVTWLEFPFPPASTDVPVSLPSLGIAYRVLNRVDRVIAGSPAEAAGMHSGDVIQRARFLPPKGKEAEVEKPLQFSADERNWPLLVAFLQVIDPESTVELTLEGKKDVVLLKPAKATGWFNPRRGLLLETKTVLHKADTPGEAVSLGFDKTVDCTLLVYRVLKNLFTNQISPKALSGPIGILQVANAAASSGLADLLVFLVLLSANLAVLNFLPIPILDGGHFVFLAYEGIRGKPASEKLQVALTYAGLFLLLALMVWVFGLDLGVISRE